MTIHNITKDGSVYTITFKRQTPDIDGNLVWIPVGLQTLTLQEVEDEIKGCENRIADSNIRIAELNSIKEAIEQL